MKSRVLWILLGVVLPVSVGLVSCTGEVLPEYNLTVSATEGGEITSPGEGASNYDEGTEVPLVALPHSGYRFVSWTGDVDEIADVDAASTSITMNDNYSVTANFIAQYDLRIGSTDGGDVTIPGEGTLTYDTEALVDLVAEPEEGYKFVSWTGDVGTIVETADAETTITMNSDHSITANFQPDWIQNPTNGHYYVLTPDLTWGQAEAWAQEWGGHLVTLRNWEEELWIKDTFGRNECFWIGFSDIEEEGNWVWSSGEAVTYTNWNEGEPNDCGGLNEAGLCNPEDAAVMNWQGDYWNDLPRIITQVGVAEFASSDG